MIPDDHRRRIRRFEEQGVLFALREAFSQRPEWREFSACQLFILMFLYGYVGEPPEEFDLLAALPFALEDREGAA
jgi:hypothetical protein